MSDYKDVLKKLHTRIIDSLEGYKSALEQTDEGMTFTSYLNRRIAEREEFHTRLHQQLGVEGIEVSESGSAAAAAHRGWLSLRDAVTGGDEAVYDEIINGETALLENYDDAIDATRGKPGYDFLADQRTAVQRAADEARAEKTRHAA
jgi:uncharacterized protein (TIGR02284 family)